MSRHRRTEDLSGQYLLGCVVEESGEVIQIGGKILRHGWGSYSPFDPERTSNAELLARETGDLIGAVRFLVEQGFINKDIVEEYARARVHKLQEICPLDELAPIEEEDFDIPLPEPRTKY